MVGYINLFNSIGLKNVRFFYENPRNMKGARYKMLLIRLGKNKKLLIPEIMKLRVKMRDKNSPKIEYRGVIFSQHDISTFQNNP